MIRVAIIGALGKMSYDVICEIIKSDQCVLTYALVRSGNEHIGKDVGEYFFNQPLGICFTDDRDMWDKIDVVIDFSASDVSLDIARECANHHKVHIIGTTAINSQKLDLIKEYAKNCVILFSFNMSFGVNLFANIASQFAAKLGEDFDIEILETHHRYKKDAPSGTSLMLADEIAKAKNLELSEHLVLNRTNSLEMRKKNDISISSIRGGEGIFEHKILFLGDNEIIELSHKANNRKIYAQGALKAAIWALNQEYGLYSIKDMLAT